MLRTEANRDQHEFNEMRCYKNVQYLMFDNGTSLFYPGQYGTKLIRGTGSNTNHNVGKQQNHSEIFVQPPGKDSLPLIFASEF